MGQATQAVGTSTTAVGGQALATATAATAYGWRAEATAERATAIGHLATASGVRSVALGEAAIASGEFATALGNQASATFANSTALGNGATTTRANQVVLGGAGTSVTIGDIAASTAAQAGTIAGGSIFVATTDASGTLGQGPAVNSFATQTQLAATNANVAANAANIGTLFDLTDLNRRDIRKANEGVAMALAMETPHLPAGTNVGLSGGLGYYQERVAGTMALAARVGQNASVSAGVGIGFDSGEVGARGGFQVAW